MSISSLSKLLASFSFFACTSLCAAPLTVDVTGIQSFGEFTDAGNTVLNFDVGANATIVSVDFDFVLTADSPSYLSEMGLFFSDSKGGDGVFFNPGIEDEFGGTGSYSGSVLLSDYGLTFLVGNDGILRLEFYEDFDDFFGDYDGIWSGTITFGIEPAVVDVPEPATVLLLGAGLMMLVYGRRRGAAPKKSMVTMH